MPRSQLLQPVRFRNYVWPVGSAKHPLFSAGGGEAEKGIGFGTGVSRRPLFAATGDAGLAENGGPNLTR